MAKHHAAGKRMIANTQRDLSMNVVDRAPTLKVRIVPCPECKAQIGESCLSVTGGARTQGHASRRRLAIRKLLEERSHGAEA